MPDDADDLPLLVICRDIPILHIGGPYCPCGPLLFQMTRTTTGADIARAVAEHARTH